MPQDLKAFLDRHVTTWQDLHHVLDQLRERRFASGPTDAVVPGDMGNIALVGLDFGPDSTFAELTKITAVIRRRAAEQGGSVRFHWMAGSLDIAEDLLYEEGDETFLMPAMRGYESWGDPYFHLFATSLDRDHRAYRQLPGIIWEQAVSHATRLARYFERQGVDLVVAAGLAAVPGNVSATLGLVLASEFLDLTVINLSEHYFWEGHFAPPGLCGQEHWLINRHLSEVTSLLDLLYPWAGPRWFHICASPDQAESLIHRRGVNPATVTWQPPCVDPSVFRPRSLAERRVIHGKLDAFFDPAGQSPVTEDIHAYYPSRRSRPKPVILGSRAGLDARFTPETIVLLQPTRIAPERGIEWDLAFVEAMVRHETFAKSVPGNLVLFVSGPVLSGCETYAEDVCEAATALMDRLPADLADRVRVAFSFGELVFDETTGPGDVAPTVSEVYGISDMVLVPSRYEGRCLPAAEAAATGLPIVINEFDPKGLYQAIVEGIVPDRRSAWNLLDTGTDDDLASARRDKIQDALTGTDESGREEAGSDSLLVIDIAAVGVGEAAIQALSIVSDLEERRRVERHNMRLARQRLSTDVLAAIWSEFLDRIDRSAGRLGPAGRRAEAALEALVGRQTSQALRKVAAVGRRRYLPGMFPLGYLYTVRGLVEPTGYHFEEMQTATRLFHHARFLADRMTSRTAALELFAMGEWLVMLPGNPLETPSDHSLAYRHRRSVGRRSDGLTEQQLVGLLAEAADDLDPGLAQVLAAEKRACWQGSLRLLSEVLPRVRGWVKLVRVLAGLEPEDPMTGGAGREAEALLASMERPLGVDDTGLFLQEVVYRPRKLVHICSEVRFLPFELEILGRRLLAHWRSLAARAEADYEVVFVARNNLVGTEARVSDIEEILETDTFSELAEARRQGHFRILGTDGRSLGCNLADLSESCTGLLTDPSVVVTASGPHHLISLDLLDRPSFRFGRVQGQLAAQMIGVKPSDAFCVFVPPAVRVVVGHPFVVQDAVTLSRQVRSPAFKALVRLDGMDATLRSLAAHADRTGSRVDDYLEMRARGSSDSEALSIRPLCGLHQDGVPYHGTSLRIATSRMAGRLRFVLLTSRTPQDTVEDMARRFESETGRPVIAAWNGGYVLNEQVVARLGLRRECVGTPLGLVVREGRVLCPPLFNRPVLAAGRDGRVQIDRLSMNFGGALRIANPRAPAIRWRKSAVNPSQVPRDDVAVYTLAWHKETIPIKDRVILVLAGRFVTKVVSCEEVDEDEVSVHPVGLHVSIPVDRYYDELRDYYFEGMLVEYDFAWTGRWRQISDAVEAGPLLLRSGRIAVDLDAEYWPSDRSISTQAGRLHDEDLRGPKLGVGLTKHGDVVALAVNGRLRDSFGATYHELAQLLKDEGVTTAMGFDPGGSVTLVANGTVKNVPAFNPNHRRSPFTARPRPRPVPNAFACIVEKE